MITEEQARELIGRDLMTETGERVGRIGQIFLDDETGRPEWVTVHTGLFGTSESFVPLTTAEVGDIGLTVPYDKVRIKDAPNIDVDAGHLSREEEAQLYDYYGLTYTGAPEDGSEAPGTMPMVGFAFPEQSIPTPYGESPAIDQPWAGEPEPAAGSAITESTDVPTDVSADPADEEAGGSDISRARLRRYVIARDEIEIIEEDGPGTSGGR